MRPRRAGAVFLAALVLSSCTASEPAARPDILLVTIDTLRADRLGCYGDRDARTPTLDALAADGVRFSNAAAVAPTTLPSHSSILTGRYPATHGVRLNGTFVLAPEEQTLAELMRAEGYRTGAFVGAYPLARRFGLDQGFDHYDDRIERPSAETASGAHVFLERSAGDVTDAALGWLDRQPPEGPLFTWVHYFDPHADYQPPPPFDRGFPDPYRGEISYTDQELGRLLDGLRDAGRLERTVIIVTSDHGEAFGEHGMFHHGLFIYEETMRIPLIVASPTRLERGQVVDAVVSHVDLAPTVLALVGASIPDSIEGIDLTPSLTAGGRLVGRDGVVLESLVPRLQFGWSELYGLRTDAGWKLIDAPRDELFNLGADPDERDDRSGQERARLESMRAALARLRARSEALASGSAVAAIDEETIERLRSLGYLGGAALPSSATAPGSDVDPKDRVELHHAFQEVNLLLRLGRTADAIELGERMLASEPDSMFLELQLASAYLDAGDPARAREIYQGLLERAATNCTALRGLIRVEEEEGQLRRETVRAALECDPAQPGLWARLATIAAQAGEMDAAVEHLREAVRMAPFDEGHRRRLADGYLLLGREEDARSLWLDLIELDPGAVAGFRGLGTIALAGGRLRQAETWFRKALELASDPEIEAMLGAVLLSQGRLVEACERLRAGLVEAEKRPAVRLDLALCLARRGDLDGALDEALRIERGELAIDRGLERLAVTFDEVGRAAAAAQLRDAEPPN